MGVYKRNLIPVLLLTIKIWVLAMLGMVASGTDEFQLGIVLLYIGFYLVYSAVNSYIVMVAHKVGVYMRNNPEKTVKHGLTEATTVKEFLIDGTIYFVVDSSVSAIVGFIVSSLVSSLFGVGLMGVLGTIIELNIIIGFLLFGIILAVTLAVMNIVVKGVTDSVLVYLLTHEKRDMKESLRFVRENTLRFGVVATVYTVVQTLISVITLTVGVVVVMPWVLDWKYNHWLKDRPEFS